MEVRADTVPFAMLTSSDPSAHLSFLPLGQSLGGDGGGSHLFPGAPDGGAGELVAVLSPVTSFLCESGSYFALSEPQSPIYK